VLIALSVPQLLQTIYFFIQPFKLKENPIPTEGMQVCEGNGKIA
jgi:hypothetical protein